MKRGLKTWLAVALPVLGLALFSTAEAASGPAAKLMQVEGNVEYSKNGDRWRAVTRTKYLFEGYHVRTGADGSAQLIDQASGDARDLGSNSHIQITESGPQVIAGSLSEPEDSGTSFFQALLNKFSKAQRYTTVRRSVDRDTPVKLATGKDVTVSETYPELVWENVGPEYSYRLTIGDNTFEVPVASTAEMIRFSVPELAPGEYDYKVEVVLNGQPVYTPRSKSTIHVLSGEQEQKYLAQEQQLRDSAMGDEFMLGSLMEENGFLVPAMDTYRQYFGANPDDNEMRPLLIKAYNDLKLYDLKDREARTYNGLLESDS